MRRIAAVATLALFAGLTGCSTEANQQSSGAVPESQSADSVQSAPAPSPTEKVLDKAAAGELYLHVICDSNETNSAFNEAAGAANEVAATGQTPDITPVTASAAEAVAREREAVTVFDDSYYVWPDSVKEHIKDVRSTLMTELSTFQQIASADSWETIVAVTPAETDLTASQEVRYQLGLDADTETSCEGMTGHLSQLAKESAERQE